VHGTSCSAVDDDLLKRVTTYPHLNGQKLKNELILLQEHKIGCIRFPILFLGSKQLITVRAVTSWSVYEVVGIHSSFC